MRRLIDLVTRWGAHRWFRAHLVLIGLVLAAPSLWMGFHTDDLMHRAGFLQPDRFGFMDSPLDMFGFITGDAEENREFKDAGVLMWFAADSLRLNFYRPVTAMTHWLDYLLWPSSPMLMHLHSLAWFAAFLYLVATLFRQIMPQASAASLAALMFVLDDAHALPAAWLANRNSMVASVFAALCLIAYHRWRRRGGLTWACLPPLFLLASLLSAEMGLATAAFLFSYALFLDRTAGMRRWIALLPCAAVALGWMWFYRSQGYGAAGSGAYIDPAGSPGLFLEAMADRFVLLAWGQLSFPPTDASLILSRAVQTAMWAAALLGVIFVFWAMAGLLVASREARFFGLGMVIALVPSCATWASDRLLMIAGIGGMGLVGLFVVRWRDGAATQGWKGTLRGALCAWFLAVHLVFAPLYFLPSLHGFKSMGRVIDRASASLPKAEPEQEVYVLSVPFAFLVPLGPVTLALNGGPVPRRVMALCTSIAEVEVTRMDAHSLDLAPNGGFLLPPGTDPESASPPFSSRYLLPLWDQLLRAPSDTFAAGDTVELTGLRITMMEVTHDGRPARVRFTFDRPLEDEGYVWLEWHEGVYRPVEMPKPGETMLLPLPNLPGLGF